MLLKHLICWKSNIYFRLLGTMETRKLRQTWRPMFLLASLFKAAIKQFLSETLFKVFCLALSLYQGYQTVLTDTKNFADIQKAEIYVKVQAAYQGAQSYYEYMMEYYNWYLELTRLGEKGGIFEKEMAENFKLGINERDVNRLSAYFHNKNADTFEKCGWSLSIWHQKMSAGKHVLAKVQGLNWQSRCSWRTISATSYLLED
ncbi:hypothetical protein BDR26DRAFT_891906 [Obelidium mucronatum]|nr:hypothetical protein BDR26DRAFT_891906 [Obelidium mucronatum]